MLFQQKETRLLVLTILLLGLIFGFNDGETVFNPTHFFLNFVQVTVMAGIGVLVHEVAHKLVARHKNLEITYQFWTLDRMSPAQKIKHGVPIGIIIALLVTFFSNGTFYFTAIGENRISVDPKKRIGRKWTEVLDYEQALILLSGPIANILLVIVLNAISRFTSYDLTPFMMINLFMAFWTMLPLPGLDGGKIFFGSRNVYFFGLTFLVMGFLLQKTGIFFSIGISLITAIAILILYYYKYEK